MEKIKVGDFIRTYQGDIGKAQTVTSTGIIIEDERHIHFDRITKHNKNIIDLIECGDYVNGYKVRCTKYEYFGHFFIDLEEDVNAGSGYGYQLHEKDIKSIVTHEQFNSIKYEVI